MNKTFYVLLCLISSHTFAGDDGGPNVNVQIEEEELQDENPPVSPGLEIQLDGYVESPPPYQERYSLQRADVRPGSALDLSHELTRICYGQECTSNKFGRKPLEEYLKQLKQTNYSQYQHIAGLIQTTNTADPIPSAQQRRGIGYSTPTNDVPIELMQVLLKALKTEDKLKTGVILEHERASEGKDYTIKDLKTWGSRKNWGLAGTISSCLLLILGYFGYTLSPC